MPLPTAPAKTVKEPAKNGAQTPEKPAESKADRFKRLANMRVPNAIKRIGHVSNLSLRAQYEYTPEQAATIVKLLQDELDSLKRRFSTQDAKSVPANIF